MAQKRIIGEIAPGIFLSLFLFLIPAAGGAQTTSPPATAALAASGWSQLSVPQKIILAPLADEWDSLPPFRQKQWLGVAARFPALGPDEQRRLQGQMQKWRKLTSDERHTARESYRSASQMSVEKRQELKQKWEEYSSLPEEERERLKNRASAEPKRQKFILPDSAIPRNFPEEARRPSLEANRRRAENAVRP